MSSDGWWMYNLSTSDQLERCFGMGLPTCLVQIGSHTYNVNYSSMLQTYVPITPNDIKQRSVKRVIFDSSVIDTMNIKGISGMYFKTIEAEIGKFV